MGEITGVCPNTGRHMIAGQSLEFKISSPQFYKVVDLQLCKGLPTLELQYI